MPAGAGMVRSDIRGRNLGWTSVGATDSPAQSRSLERACQLLAHINPPHSCKGPVFSTVAAPALFVTSDTLTVSYARVRQIRRTSVFHIGHSRSRDRFSQIWHVFWGHTDPKSPCEPQMTAGSRRMNG